MLLQPTWKHILSYETRWMDRDTLAEVTYEAGARLNQLKRDCGLISQAKAQEVASRIVEARALMQEIEALMTHLEGAEFERALLRLKPGLTRPTPRRSVTNPSWTSP